MITTAELHRAAEEEGLRFDQVEKDYVILWILQGLSHSESSAKASVFIDSRINNGYPFNNRLCYGACDPMEPLNN